jgi:hypothetical protein
MSDRPRVQRFALLFSVGFLALSIALIFDHLLVHLSTDLAGESPFGALALWHTWWPQFGLGRSEVVALNAYSGAPFISNHLLYMPILQSAGFSLLNSLFQNPLTAFNLLLVLNCIATFGITALYCHSKGGDPFIGVFSGSMLILSGWYYANLVQANIIITAFWLLPLLLLIWDAWMKTPRPIFMLAIIVTIYIALLSGVQHLFWLLTLFLPYAVWSARSKGLRASPFGQWPPLDQVIVGAGVIFLLLLIYPLPGIVRTLQSWEPNFGPPIIKFDVGYLKLFLTVSPVIFILTAVGLIFRRPKGEALLWLAVGIGNLLMALTLLPDIFTLITSLLGLPKIGLDIGQIAWGTVLFSLLVFNILVLKPWWDWLSQTQTLFLWGTVAALCGAMIIATPPLLLHGYPTKPLVSNPIYSEIAAEPEDYLVLSYPFGLKSLQNEHELGQGAELSLYAVWYHKRTISGIAPFYPDNIFSRFEHMPFLFPESFDPQDQATIAAFADAVRTWRIGYVLVYTDYVSPDTSQRIDALTAASLELCPPIQVNGLIVYRAKWHPKGCSN